MLKQKIIQIRFKEQTEYGEYNDCLYFTEKEYAEKTEQELDFLMNERVNNWIKIITEKPVLTEETKTEETKEEIQVQIDGLNIQIANLEERKVNLLE